MENFRAQRIDPPRLRQFPKPDLSSTTLFFPRHIKHRTYCGILNSSLGCGVYAITNLHYGYFHLL